MNKVPTKSARDPAAEKSAARRPRGAEAGKRGRPKRPEGDGHPPIRPAAAIVPQQSVAGRALTLVVAIMAFLACLTVGAVTLVHDAARDWRNDLVREVTIQIRPVDGVDMLREIDKATALAQEFPGVGRVRALSDAETRSLLQPWLGGDLDLDNLPVPRLVTVELSRPDKVDFEALARAVSEQVRGGSLDDHSVWTQRLSAMAGAVVFAGIVILALVMTAMVLSVVFATRAAMAGNRGVVEVLHLVGAENAFIAREFERHFLKLGLKGGLAGGGVALLSFLIFDLLSERGVGYAGADQFAALVGGAGIGWTGYLGVAGVVLLVALLTALTSRLAVHNHLARLE